MYRRELGEFAQKVHLVVVVRLAATDEGTRCLNRDENNLVSTGTSIKEPFASSAELRL
jgi:hypothetical protein